jgi:hypothetical protein
LPFPAGSVVIAAGAQDDFMALGAAAIAAMVRGEMALKQTPAEAIVRFLSFSSASRDSAPQIEKFTRRQWEHVQLWLDDAGLAFYFLERLKNTNSTAIIPPSVLSRWERNFAANQARVDHMSLRFKDINQRFDDRGVRYEVVKGFSLVPEFCPYSSLRYQADLDYLVADESLPEAKRILADAGYDSRDSFSGKESIFVTPGAKPSRGDFPYLPHAPHAVELHTDIWDSEMHELRPIPKLFSVGQAKMRHWNGLSFPAQTDEDAFLLQVLHACRHLFTQWIRVSNLLEIAYFLNRRRSDTDVWDRAEKRVGENAIVKEFVVIVVELAARLFSVPVPGLVQDWGARIDRQSRVWIEHYGRNWLLCELPVYGFSLFPQSKLVLFLQQQYRSVPVKARPKNNDRSPASRFSRIISSLRFKPALLLNREWRKRHLLVRRSVFYALAQARYICEIPRWRWRTRTSVLPGMGRVSLPSKTNS